MALKNLTTVIIVGNHESTTLLLALVRELTIETQHFNTLSESMNANLGTLPVIYTGEGSDAKTFVAACNSESESFFRTRPVLAWFPYLTLRDRYDLLALGIDEVLDKASLTVDELQLALGYVQNTFSASERSREREQMFTTLCDALPFQMSYRILVPAGGKPKFLYVSSGVEKISGLAPEAIMKDSDRLYSLILSEDRTRLALAEEDAVRTLKPLDIEVRKRNTAGEARWVHIRSFPQKFNDDSILWDGVETDITKYKVAEARVKQLLVENERLLKLEQEARNLAEQHSKMKDNFLATISHELRTPINSVLGWVQLMKRKRLTAEQIEKGMETVERNALLQAQLISDLLDVNKIVSGKIELTITSVNLAEVIRDVVDTVTPLAVEKSISLSLDLHDEKFNHVKGDQSRLQQVFWNLLTNSIKFTPPGGTICISVVYQDPYFLVEVTDSGVGIEAEFLPRIFQRFSQAKASYLHSETGLGLGLSIVFELVQLHGGDVLAASDGPGKGARFTVKLPVSTSYCEIDSTRTLSSVNAVVLKNVHLLLVDDNKDALGLTSEILQSHGAETTVCQSADDALEKCRDSRASFDILISDIGMPEKDGYALLRELRTDYTHLQDVPVLALSAFNSRKNLEKAKKAGFAGFIAKPVEVDTLISEVCRVLSINPEANAKYQ